MDLKHLLTLGAFAVCQALPDADLVTSLPSAPALLSPQYSGFLDGGDGIHLHYWLVTCSADADWQSRPVVLWLNGGPGSSSVLGMLQEQGPMLIARDGGLHINPWAWSTLVNFVIFEAPAGVGYSYCNATLRGEPCLNTDNSTSAASHHALLDLFGNKFPELAANRFFIMGESYAGVYVPTLARRVLDGNDRGDAPRINLHGVAVGDPCTDNDSQSDSMDVLWYANKYGLVEEDDFDLLWNRCGLRFPSLIAAGGFTAGERQRGATRPSHARRLGAHGTAPSASAGYRPAHGWVPPAARPPTPRPAAGEAAAAVAKAAARAKHAAAGAKASVQEAEAAAAAAAATAEAAAAAAAAAAATPPDAGECLAAERRFLLSTSRGLSQTWPLGFLNDYALFDPPEASIDDRTAAWMNRPDVQRALHVDTAPHAVWDPARASDKPDDPGYTGWPGPAPGWKFESQYAACNPKAAPGALSMVDIHRELARRLPGRLLIFNGDADPCVSYEGTRRAVKKIGYAQLPGGGYRPWFFNATATTAALLARKDVLFGTSLSLTPEGAQLGGFVVDYEHGLSFATVHGSGHMVPQCRPREALTLLRHLITDHDLAPPLLTDEKLAALATADYAKYTDEYVKEASAAEYIGA